MSCSRAAASTSMVRPPGERDEWSGTDVRAVRDRDADPPLPEVDAEQRRHGSPPRVVAHVDAGIERGDRARPSRARPTTRTGRSHPGWPSRRRGSCRGSRPRSRPGRPASTWRAVMVTGNVITPSSTTTGRRVDLARALDQRVARLDLRRRCSPQRPAGPPARRPRARCRSRSRPGRTTRPPCRAASPGRRCRSASPRLAVSGKTVVPSVASDGSASCSAKLDASWASSAFVAAVMSAWTTRGNSSRFPPLVGPGS